MVLSTLKKTGWASKVSKLVSTHLSSFSINYCLQVCSLSFCPAFPEWLTISWKMKINPFLSNLHWSGCFITAMRTLKIKINYLIRYQHCLHYWYTASVNAYISSAFIFRCFSLWVFFFLIISQSSVLMPIFLFFFIALDLFPTIHCHLSYLVCKQDKYISLICIDPIFSILDNKAEKKTKN